MGIKRAEGRPQPRLVPPPRTFLDLSSYELPIYNADLERSTGIPDEAVEIARQIRSVDGLVIASPEYNGAYSALLKNTLDWVTRVDRSAWALPTALMSATPGRSGGRRGLAVLRSTLENMSVPVTKAQLTLANAPARLADGQLVNAGDRVELERVIGDLVASIVRRAA